MIIKINSIKTLKITNNFNYVVCIDKKFEFNNLKSISKNIIYTDFRKFVYEKNVKKRILSFDLNTKNKIIFIKVEKKFEKSEIETLGAELYSHLKNEEIKDVVIDTTYIDKSFQNNFIGYFLHGFKLKSYEFRIYKSNQ